MFDPSVAAFPANPTAKLKRVVLSTDGSCPISNPGPLGWACVLRFGDNMKEASGFEPWGTNNYAELRAIVEGMKLLKEPCDVLLRTDSECAAAWCRNPDAKRLRTNPKYAHLRGLLDEFRQLAMKHTLTILWIRGHTGDGDNERCDELAAQAVARSRNQFST